MADKTESEERQIFLYMKQIQYLDKELERCQHECDDLEKENKDLDYRCRMLGEDQRDIADCLKYSLVANKMTEWLESQQQGNEQDSKALKLQHSQDIQELQDRIDELKGRIDELDSAFMMQAAKSEEQMELLKQQLAYMESLEKQMEDYKAVFDRLNRKALLEKIELHKVDFDAIELNISNVVQEERAQCRDWSEQCHHLLHKGFNRMLLRDDLQKNLQSVSFKMDIRRKVGNKRTELITQERERNLKRCQLLEVKTKHYRTKQKHKLAKEEELRRDMASESEECRQITPKTSQLEVDLQRERSKRRELNGIMWEAISILRQIMTGSEGASDTHSKKQRLKEVLEILKPPLTSAETPDLPDDPSFLLIRYRVGDFNIVPRPTWKCKPVASIRTQLLPTRKLCSQKTSSSADPSPQDPQSDSSED